MLFRVMASIIIKISFQIVCLLGWNIEKQRRTSKTWTRAKIYRNYVSPRSEEVCTSTVEVKILVQIVSLIGKVLRQSTAFFMAANISDLSARAPRKNVTPIVARSLSCIVTGIASVVVWGSIS